MATSMKENGIRAFHTVMALPFSKMVEGTQANSLKAREADTEYAHSKTVLNMKESGSRI